MAPHVNYEAVAEVFDLMRTETLDGRSMSEIVGGGSPMSLAIHFMGILVEQAGLESGDRVLDIGCGCGRLAAALTQHLGPQASYVGVDIVAGLVDFANRHIPWRHPNFRFVTLQQGNPAYDAIRHDGESPTIASLDDACAPQTVDLCIATSLFTHFDTEMARTALKAMRRALAPDGRAFISLFLLDAGVRALIGRGGAAFQFEHRYADGVFVQNLGRPLEALAFTSGHFIDLLSEHGLYVERALYGRWPGRAGCVSGQDILIVRRMPGG
jgi:SAM-dependent methyltransferase